MRKANSIARRVALGGSALRVAYAEAEEKLVNERIVVLKAVRVRVKAKSRIRGRKATLPCCPLALQ